MNSELCIKDDSYFAKIKSDFSYDLPYINYLY
jgi:hypothetical protein